jgi:site-specific DNA recombinase
VDALNGADHSWKYRNYICRGKLNNYHLDGSPKCTNRNIRADLIEEVVWRKVMDIINDPNKLEPMLIEAIDELKDRESVLETRILPMEKRLKEIAEMKSHLVKKWVLENMDTEKYRIAQQGLDKEEARLIALRRKTNPNEMAELE